MHVRRVLGPDGFRWLLMSPTKRLMPGRGLTKRPKDLVCKSHYCGSKSVIVLVQKFCKVLKQVGHAAQGDKWTEVGEHAQMPSVQ